LSRKGLAFLSPLPFLFAKRTSLNFQAVRLSRIYPNLLSDLGELEGPSLGETFTSDDSEFALFLFLASFSRSEEDFLFGVEGETAVFRVYSWFFHVCDIDYHRYFIVLFRWRLFR